MDQETKKKHGSYWGSLKSDNNNNSNNNKDDATGMTTEHDVGYMVLFCFMLIFDPFVVFGFFPKLFL